MALSESGQDNQIDASSFSDTLNRFFWPDELFQNYKDLGSLQRLLENEWAEKSTSALYGHSLMWSTKGDGSWKETCITQVDILTTSQQKWLMSADIIRRAGLIPNQRNPDKDETIIHQKIRELPLSSTSYPVLVAYDKQPSTTGLTAPIPMVTMDTVTWIDGESMPREKPKNQAEAITMIARLSDKRVTAITGIVAKVPIQSSRWGRWIQLYTQVDMSYKMQHISQKDAAAYVANTPNVRDIAGSLNLSTSLTRALYIDPSVPMVISSIDFLGKRKQFTVTGNQDVLDPSIDPYFAGAPPRPLEHFVFLFQEIYTQLK